MNQEQIKYVNEMKAIKAVDELIALAEQAKGFMYKGNFSEARYSMTLLSRGSVFALEQIDKINEVNHD
tara:strand:- start:104 stop:307 length:204 start_codon:yes stop_codon:yes gene_type:complete